MTWRWAGSRVRPSSASRRNEPGVDTQGLTQPRGRRAAHGGLPRVRPAAPRWPHDTPLLVVLDVGVKAVLLFFLALVAVDPGWGNLEGKAPVARAVTYPMVALLAPVVIRWCQRRAPFPWGADLLISLTCFSDILGNRLDLYDTVAWFDDWMHFMNTGLIAGAVVALTTTVRHAATDVALRAVAIGMTLALGWEVFEYVSFVTRSPELPLAYGDTVVDLCLGWFGSCVAGCVVAALHSRRRHRDLRSRDR